MFNYSTARFLWVLSFFFPGLHRFYLGKWASGLFYLFTGGIGYIGTIIDGFNLHKMVAEANYINKYKQVLYHDIPVDVLPGKKESVEKIILKTAKKNHGIITSSEVALEGDITIENAKTYLEKLAKKGFAEMRVKTNGVIVFCFPEFMKETGESNFEDF